MKVFKYNLNLTDAQIITIPDLSEVIDVQVQDGSLVLWAIIDKETSLYSSVNIYIAATGQDFGNDFYLSYLATFQHEGFVGHVFYDYGIG